MNHLPNTAGDRPQSTVSSQPTAGAARARTASGRPTGSAKNRSSSGFNTGLFVILFLMLLALFGQTVQDAFQLDRARTTLDQQIAQQVETLNEAQKVRAQLEAIAGDTAALAEAGNQNAIQLRDFLAQKGVTIQPPGR